MANYVKFMRGTPDAYARLVTKDLDTLYFIAEKDDDNGLLYLGDKLIGDGNGGAGVVNLKDLTDVLLSTELANASFLTYDANAQKWVDTKKEDLLFVGATSLSDGKAGFVPAPTKGQENYFLRGDGVWAEVIAGNASNIYQIVPEMSETDADAITRVVNSPIKGDIVVVKRNIFGDNYQHITYVYDGTQWVALDNYYDASKVILSDSGNSIDNFLISLFEDNTNIEIGEANHIRLRDWGVKYYRFVEASENIEAHYEIQLVDETHPWKSGLEPRVVNEDSELVLGWYEPNTTTVDGLSTQIAALGNQIEAGLNERYTKDETDTKIANAVAAANHLTREIVEDIDLMTEENVIYMLPTGLQADDDKYDEYMVINGIPEKIGSWEVDLSAYAKTSDVETALSNKVDKEEGSRLLTSLEAIKLASIEEGAQKNIILTVGDGLNIDENKKLTIVGLPNDVDLSENASLIAALNKKLNPEDQFITSVEEEQLQVVEKKLSIKSVSIDIVSGLKDQLASINNKLDSIPENIDSRLSALENVVTWQALE